MSEYRIDPRLENDSFLITGLPLCQVRLMDDSRWPWLILVPCRSDISEIHELDGADQAQLARETAICAGILKEITGCTKINSGALGNIVRQLHIHVIARNESDPNWPGPVWGFGERVPYQDDDHTQLTEAVKAAIQREISEDDD